MAPPRHPGERSARLPHPAAPFPKSGCAGLSLFAALRELQRLLACWAGACPTCGRRLPPSTVYLHVPP
ncbi:MAG: hypothetical protein FJZ97_13780 [Chloroflexi bacterium]|nr:hypothetical protein [Chloroflexota bacterium]